MLVTCPSFLFTVVCRHCYMSEYMWVLQYKLTTLLLTFFFELAIPNSNLNPTEQLSFTGFLWPDFYKVEFTIAYVYNIRTAVYLQLSS